MNAQGGKSMSNKKMVTTLLSAFFVSSVVLSGCSSSTTSTATSAPSEKAKSETATEAPKAKKDAVSLTLAIWDKGQQGATEAITAEFMKANPNITVKVEVTPWDDYWVKRSAEATSGTLPDVFWMHSGQFLKYATGKFIAPLTDKVKAGDIDLNNYVSNLGNVYTLDGVPYAVPKDFDTIGLAYNKELFQKANIPFPDDTWDYTKLAEVAKKLTDASKGIYGFAAKADTQIGYWNDMLAFGGSILSPDMKKSGYDSPESIAALKQRYQMIVDKSSPTVQQMTDTDPREMFKSGKLAMMFEGSWQINDIYSSDIMKGKWDWAKLPKGPKTRGNIINGLGYSMSAASKHQEEAWLLTKFLGSKQAAQIFADKGAAIPAFKDTQDAWLKSKPDLNLKVFPEQAKEATPYPAGSKSYPVWFTKEAQIMAPAFGGKQSIEDAAKAVAKAMNDAIAAEK